MRLRKAGWELPFSSLLAFVVVSSALCWGSAEGGVSKGRAVLGIQHKNAIINLTPFVRGGSAVVECAGLLYQMLLLHVASDSRAREVAVHVGSSPGTFAPSPDDIFATSGLVPDFINIIMSLANIFTSGLVLVFEGPEYEMKGDVAKAQPPSYNEPRMKCFSILRVIVMLCKNNHNHPRRGTPGLRRSQSSRPYAPFCTRCGMMKQAGRLRGCPGAHGSEAPYVGGA